MMWELIAANKRRSVVLIAAMGLLLVSLGFVIGAAFFPAGGEHRAPRGQQVRYVDANGHVRTAIKDSAQISRGHESPLSFLAFNPVGGAIGALIASGIWLVQVLVAFFVGDRILLAASGAREIQKADHPQLFNVVEEMTIAARLPKMPRVFIMEDMALNAFATGRTQENAAVTVTAGLLGRLNRDQLQGVVAHEIAHIVHRDVMYMTIAGIMVGTVVMISDLFLRNMFYASGGRYRSDNRGKGNGQMIMLVVAIVLAILAPILAQLLYFALSRRREYLADAGGAVYTRYPEGLASALEAIHADPAELTHANRATAPMYIINPLQKARRFFSGLNATHPPVEKRIAALRAMNSATYGSYENAFARAVGGHIMPKSALKQGGEAGLREGSGGAPLEPGAQRHEQRARMHEAGDVVRMLNQFTFLTCACGMKVKLPPALAGREVACPRCNRMLGVPSAAPDADASVDNDASAEAGAPLSVTRASSGWTTIRCTCGATKNLPPSFAAPHAKCSNCGRKIIVRSA